MMTSNLTTEMSAQSYYRYILVSKMYLMYERLLALVEIPDSDNSGYLPFTSRFNVHGDPRGPDNFEYSCS